MLARIPDACYSIKQQASAAEATSFFRQLDTMVLQRKARIYYLGYFGYSDDFRIIHGMKAPYRDEAQNIIGINCHFQDVTRARSINKDHFMLKPDYTVYNDNKCKQFYCLFIEHDENDMLSSRESECFFFFLEEKQPKKFPKFYLYPPHCRNAYRTPPR